MNTAIWSNGRAEVQRTKTLDKARADGDTRIKVSSYFSFLTFKASQRDEMQRPYRNKNI